MHINVLKQALKHGLVFKKVHRVIQFNQKDLLKSYIDMNTKLRKEAKNDFEKRKKLVSEPNYDTAKRFSENKKNNPIYLGMSILNINAYVQILV